MSISELGSLGEFTASIAVLITLLLLLIQFRATRSELSGQVTREIKRYNNDTLVENRMAHKYLSISDQSKRGSAPHRVSLNIELSD